MCGVLTLWQTQVVRTGLQSLDGGKQTTKLREANLERLYWLRRESDEIAQASIATSIEARSIHSDLAERYSVKAAHIAEEHTPSYDKGKQDWMSNRAT